MALRTLSYNDVGRIVYDFDHAKFGVAKPVSDNPKPSQILAAKQIVLNQFQNSFLREKVQCPVELIDVLARQHIATQPSVGALLNFYIGLPYLEGRTTVLAKCEKANGYLNASSKILLARLNIQPSNKQEELVHFKQLMDIVFSEYFSKLTPDEKLEMLQKFQVELWDQKNPEEKLNTLQKLQEYLPDQATWGRAKMQLQFLSWKVQLVVGRVMQKGIFQACFSTVVFAAAGYVAYHLYSHRVLIMDYTFGLFIDKIMKVAEAAMGQDPGLFGVMKGVVVIISMLGLGMYVALRVGWWIESYGDQAPWYLSYPASGFGFLFKLVSNPLGTVLVIPFKVTAYAAQKVESVSRSMDDMVIANFQKTEQFSKLLPKWHELILHPPIIALPVNQR